MPVFMDYHSTTPCDPAVLDRMLPYFTQDFGNAASRSHAWGWKAEAAVEVARQQVADLIGANPTEVIFTSGATESNNLALHGVRGEIITQATEHKAVLDVCAALEKNGCRVVVLKTDRQGRVDPDDVQRALTPQTVLVSVMHVNNEIGTVQPLAEIGAICRAAGVLLHTDAAQGLSVLPLDVQHVDLASLSAHKMYGPKGVGALYVRRKNPRVALQPLVLGGGHERGLRSGTLNVPGIVGFGEAARLAKATQVAEAARLGALTARLQQALFAGLDDISLNGPIVGRHPGNLNVAFGGVEGERLILSLRDLAVSSGSACTSASMRPSHVLQAIGVSDALSHSSIRFGLGRYNNEADVDTVASMVIEQVRKLRRKDS